MGRRRRERREGAPPLPPRPSPRVSGTGDSSAASKKSAAALGYTSDRFVMQLLPRGSPRRAPAIHRGYHVRARAVERSVRDFLLGTRGHPRRQVVSLGAGWDSLYFCLKDAGLLAGSGGRFFEVDLPEVASCKAARISGSAELRALAGGGGGSEDLGSVKYSGDGYQLLGVDLCDLALLEGALSGAGLDPATPTLILAEVVLPYIEVESGCNYHGAYQISVIFSYKVEPSKSSSQIFIPESPTEYFELEAKTLVSMLTKRPLEICFLYQSIAAENCSIGASRLNRSRLEALPSSGCCPTRSNETELSQLSLKISSLL